MSAVTKWCPSEKNSRSEKQLTGCNQQQSRIIVEPVLATCIPAFPLFPMPLSSSLLLYIPVGISLIMMIERRSVHSRAVAL